MEHYLAWVVPCTTIPLLIEWALLHIFVKPRNNDDEEN